MAPKKKNHGNESGLAGLDFGEVERVLAFMTKHNLAEFEYSRGDVRIALKRASAGAANLAAARGAAATASTPSAQAAAPAESAVVPAAVPAEELHIIKSPIVGTFFTASSPDSPAFVKPGDAVKPGQVVCIVEAMKLMNEIESDVSGIVVRVMVENSQPVEYGQPLFAIRPDGKK
jgi:acetyl-CoA carboxylase biotin carboxyl carrier protein